MAPRLSLRPVAGASRSFGQLVSRSRAQDVCLFCSLTRPNKSRRKPLPLVSSATSRPQSTIDSPTIRQASPETARSDLQAALQNLQKHAPNYVNLSRIQLALRNLSQPPGEESIRVAILGMSTGTTSSHATAKELLRLLLADPLQAEQQWEQQLASADSTQPLILHVGSEQEEEQHPHLSFTRRRDELLPEVNVSSPGLNGNNLELLLMETNPFDAGAEAGLEALEETVLVPTIDIPSNTGRYTPISTPVHRALVVGDGILGAASLVSSPVIQEDSMISAVVNFPSPLPSEDTTAYPFTVVSLPTASKALSLFRASVSNAGAYENLWYESNLPSLSHWLKTGVLSTNPGTTKPPVRALVASILRNTSATIQEEEARLLSAALSSKLSPTAVATLDQALSDWSQAAHSELQSQLDLAFTGARWRQLGWWKLFWRADDVGMLSSDMLSQRFLPEAERSVIYLAGRIKEAGLVEEHDTDPTYSGPLVASATTDTGDENLDRPTPELEGKWPTHIPYARAYLLERTVPALQALAQRLVVQSLGTSAAMSSLAGLVYVSGVWGAGAYEAGAVAALGVVWSMRRLQKKWEAARSYWEGEVREEGRKAVRVTEASVAEVFERARRREGESGKEGLEEVRKVRELVSVAEDALARLK
ncbi:Serine threonine protein phosphatase 2b catalytic subunit protein [Coniochaeta hoffmannii]|uniref:Serine threonine protein phosphatase 2b catalytic subunit protein n=1 Tax=Coniochaeta hoffmannii TaxID=91930 RepID=A0AA38RG28_9PEZI|nr:Serine threonine protein phosphatase 2b catalytic subunit protein [Coniochaeta hoffmannii]